MERDYVEIINSDGLIKKCEVIIRFYSEDNDTHYIVYKDRDEYYVAKYDDKKEISKVDTNLEKDELDILGKLLNKFLGEEHDEAIS